MPGVVVELYTSQGCSACPPADALLHQLAQNPMVIPLSLHVDYWDYIGWEDDFADPRFTDRQKAYARAAGSKMIYTPQMIVDGADRVEGNQPDQVAQAIQSRGAILRPVGLTLTREGDQLRIQIQIRQPLARGAWVQLVRYRKEQTVGIDRGENAGLTVSYTNIVTQWQEVADWPGDKPLDMVVPAPGDDQVAVIVQRAGPGEIIAAARLLPEPKDAGLISGAGVALSTKGGPDLAVDALSANTLTARPLRSTAVAP